MATMLPTYFTMSRRFRCYLTMTHDDLICGIDANLSCDECKTRWKTTRGGDMTDTRTPQASKSIISDTLIRGIPNGQVGKLVVLGTFKDADVNHVSEAAKIILFLEQTLHVRTRQVIAQYYAGYALADDPLDAELVQPLQQT